MVGSAMRTVCSFFQSASARLGLRGAKPTLSAAAARRRYVIYYSVNKTARGSRIVYLSCAGE